MPADSTPKTRDPRTELPGSGKLRSLWERRWSEKDLDEFGWYLEEPPQELIRLLEAGDLPSGAAVDLGCGPGVATSYLARFFRPAIGVDIALEAVTQARGVAAEKGASPAFLVAAAPILPLRAESFAFVFDRGCLQHVPKEAWPAYFREVDRLLVPGGTFQLFCSRPMKKLPSALSVRGARSRMGWLMGRRRRGSQFLSHAFLRRLAEPLETLSLDDVLFRPRIGPERAMTHGIFRKPGPAPA